jgi:hypothetical protein
MPAGSPGRLTGLGTKDDHLIGDLAQGPGRHRVLARPTLRFPKHRGTGQPALTENPRQGMADTEPATVISELGTFLMAGPCKYPSYGLHRCAQLHPAALA